MSAKKPDRKLHIQNWHKVLVVTLENTGEILHRLISSSHLQVTGWTSSLSAALLLSQQTDTSVIVLDHVFVSQEHDADLVVELVQCLPTLVIGGDVEDSVKHRLLDAGVRGYLALPRNIPFLVRAIDEIACGGLWFERAVLTTVVFRNYIQRYEKCRKEKTFKQDLLTQREQIVALLVSEGLRNHQVADRLNISEKTVKLHLSNIYRKLGVSSRVQLSIVWLTGQLQIVEADDTLMR